MVRAGWQFSLLCSGEDVARRESMCHCSTGVTWTNAKSFFSSFHMDVTFGLWLDQGRKRREREKMEGSSTADEVKDEAFYHPAKKKKKTSRHELKSCCLLVLYKWETNKLDIPLRSAFFFWSEKNRQIVRNLRNATKIGIC